MDPRIDEQHAALRRAHWRTRVGIIIGGVASEAVDPAGLDVDTRDLGPVVCGEDRELDRAAPRIRREDCADVFVAWTPSIFFICHRRRRVRENNEFLCNGRCNRWAALRTLGWHRSRFLDPAESPRPRLPKRTV